jgi:DNA-directed RNA polymerase subunit alpha
MRGLRVRLPPLASSLAGHIRCSSLGADSGGLLARTFLRILFFMAVSETIDIADMITGTGPFGPAELARLCEALAEDAAMHRSLKAAVRDLESASDRSPAATVRLGVGQYLLGRFNDAIATLKAADGSALALYYLGRSLIARESCDEAVEAFRKAARAGYDVATCEAAAVSCLRRAGRLDEARKALQGMPASSESSADYWCERALLAEAEMADQTEVASALERAVAIDPLHSEALFHLAVLNDRAGNDDEARGCYERSLKRFPASVGALLNLGLLHEDRDEFQEAQACYRRILEAFPNHPRAMLFLKDSSAAGDLQIDEQQKRQRDKLEQKMALPVSDFELSVRSRNCLQKMGIHTLGDLARTTEQEILESKNFGETSLIEIKEMLESQGLALGQFAPEPSAYQPMPADFEPSADDQEIFGMPITELALSVRARKCTTKLGITTIGELVRRTAEDLMECKNFGVTSLNEVREKLAERGLKLRGE